MNPPGLPELTTALRQAADTTLSGGHHRAHPIGLAPDIELRIGLRHARRRHRKLSEPIKPTQRSPLEPTLRLERPHLAGDPNGLLVRGEGGDHRTRTLTGYQPPPGRLDIRAERRHGAQTRHDDTPLRGTLGLIAINFRQSRRESHLPHHAHRGKSPAEFRRNSRGPLIASSDQVTIAAATIPARVSPPPPKRGCPALPVPQTMGRERACGAHRCKEPRAHADHLRRPLRHARRRPDCAGRRALITRTARTNQPGLIGSNLSDGCIRLRNAGVRRLARILPLGTPVYIRPEGQVPKCKGLTPAVRAVTPRCTSPTARV